MSQIAFIAGGIETVGLAFQLGNGEVGVTVEGGNRPVPLCNGTADGFIVGVSWDACDIKGLTRDIDVCARVGRKGWVGCGNGGAGGEGEEGAECSKYGGEGEVLHCGAFGFVGGG